MPIEFRKGRWKGNQWAAIDIEPIDEKSFMPLLRHLATTYDFPMPEIMDKITGYAANFTIMGTEATLDIDTYDFSIAFADESIRDQVFADLLTLGSDFLS